MMNPCSCFVQNELVKSVISITLLIIFNAISFSSLFGSDLKYDSAHYAIFLDPHDVDGFPIQSVQRIDSLMDMYQESNDSIQMIFGHLAYALIMAESSIEKSVDQLVMASDLVELTGSLELSPFLSLVEGQIYSLLKRYDEAKGHFIDATVAFKEHDVGMYLISNIYIADMLNRLDEPEESILTLEQTASLLNTIEFDNMWLYEMLSLNSLECRNASLIMTGQLQKAENSLKETIQLATKLKQGNILQNANGNISFVYLQSQDYESALKFARPDLAYSIRTGKDRSVNGLAGVMAQTHLKMNEPDSARKYVELLTKYENKFHNWTVLQNNLITMLDYHRSKNHLDSAFDVFDRYLLLIDSVVNSRKSQDFELIQSEIKLRDATQKVETLTLLNELKTQSIANKNRLNTILISFAIFLMIFLLGAYRSIKSIRKKNSQLEQQQLQIQKQNEEIIKQRDQLENNNNSLIQLNKDKNDLIAIVAHDLRSPLNQIRGLIGLIKLGDNDLQKEQNEYLDMMAGSSKRLADMIGRILNVNAIESNNIDLKIVEIDVVEILKILSINFKVLADEKNISIHHDIEDKKIVINSDQNYLIQVLENLISNAVKFSNNNGNVHLNCKRVNDGCQIIVSDDGPGISKEDQVKLFHKYQKLSATPTGNEGSFGLGLSIAKKYIEAMDGEITCESELGKGTSFIITMP